MATANVASGGEKRIFLRKASGLIRTASLVDTLIYDIGIVSVGLGVGTLLYYGPAFYPGGNLLKGCLIAGIMMALICFGMIAWSVTLPRSGGVYVFGSRILPPFLALTLSLVEITAWLFYCAIAAYWIVLLGISPALAMIGYLGHNDTILQLSKTVIEPWPMFIIGSSILILSTLILNSGMKAFLLSQKIVFTIAVLGSIFLIAVLATHTHQQFVHAFNAMMGPLLKVNDPYDAIIASAAKHGWTTQAADWKTTMFVSNWAFLPLIGAAFSISIAGEIKSVEKAQTYGMLGAILVNVGVWMITVYLADKVFGYEFIGSAVYNILNPGEGVLTTPTDASVTLLTGILTQSVLVTSLVSMGLVAWIWMWIPGMHTFGVRAVVAWAFDRVAPDALGNISPKTHTPSTAIWVTATVNIIFMALFVFTDFFKTVVILIEAAVLAWSIVLGAGIAFPYMRPHIYEKSPISRRTILGLPFMTVACACGFLASQFYFWVLFFDPIAAGHDPKQMAIVGGVFLIGVIFYFVMKSIRSSQGIDVSLAFKEIPIE